MEKKTRITGIGVINRAGCQSQELWESLCQGKSVQSGEEKNTFRLRFSGGQLRRINRYCKMGLYAADKAYEETGLGEETDAYQKGTIFTTGYGSVDAKLKFDREVAEKDPDFCSPTVFTGIVPNSSVGTVCMFLHCKGVSAVLSGGNHLEYSKLLLEQNRAQVILAGAVEEYCQELYEGLREAEAGKDVTFAEAALVLALEQTEEPKGYCVLEQTGIIGLPGFPLLEKIEEGAAREAMEELLRDYREKEPDVIFGSGNGTYFQRLEQEAMEQVFPSGEIVQGIKGITGETMGSSFSMNVAAAALCLSRGYVPESLCQGKVLAVKRILVTGFDTAGNYMCALLTKE